eukprot:CAMPEP_0182917980 /NCGR_PEP_ID=MMETSP0105_2-20130417/1811_1 /TAXON_ID=81532 ORGANISM="Acanthoeca-like sp., Strain 10tr" /NCGR_SAMPLE_ID=MMETSP0105_2 /ASSEMBLY_ACC=CAM_ASM_000205 /LENGTH=150 /DNA_ID=CAMNT_0025055007 /DNA_START=251 /DNA_END=703 /DNA_ORIENTATION=+
MVFAAGLARITTFAAGKRHLGSFADQYRPVSTDNPLADAAATKILLLQLARREGETEGPLAVRRAALVKHMAAAGFSWIESAGTRVAFGDAPRRVQDFQTRAVKWAGRSEIIRCIRIDDPGLGLLLDTATSSKCKLFPDGDPEQLQCPRT